MSFSWSLLFFVSTSSILNICLLSFSVFCCMCCTVACTACLIHQLKYIYYWKATCYIIHPMKVNRSNRFKCEVKICRNINCWQLVSSTSNHGIHFSNKNTDFCSFNYLSLSWLYVHPSCTFSHGFNCPVNTKIEIGVKHFCLIQWRGTEHALYSPPIVCCRAFSTAALIKLPSSLDWNPFPDKYPGRRNLLPWTGVLWRGHNWIYFHPQTIAVN